jgi:hypothetical protein
MVSILEEIQQAQTVYNLFELGAAHLSRLIE